MINFPIQTLLSSSPGYKVLDFSTPKSWCISILAGLDCICFQVKHTHSLIVQRDLMILWCELTWVGSWSRSLKILFVSLCLCQLWLTIWKSTGASLNHIYCFRLCLFQCGGPAHRNVWAYQVEHLNVSTSGTLYLSKTAHAPAPGQVPWAWWVPWVQIEDAVGLWYMVCSTSTLVINHANKGRICLVWSSCIAVRHLAILASL